MKYCSNCANLGTRYQGWPICKDISKVSTNPVLGGYVYANCYDARKPGAECGLYAKLYKPKLFERIKCALNF